MDLLSPTLKAIEDLCSIRPNDMPFYHQLFGQSPMPFVVDTLPNLLGTPGAEHHVFVNGPAMQEILCDYQSVCVLLDPNVKSSTLLRGYFGTYMKNHEDAALTTVHVFTECYSPCGMRVMSEVEPQYILVPKSHWVSTEGL